MNGQPEAPKAPQESKESKASKTSKGTSRIVVGVDGSESSKEALRWAVRQADLTDSHVNAVIAWEYPPLYGSIGWLDAPQELAGNIKMWADQALDGAIREVVKAGDMSRVKATVAYGTPAAVLLEAAGDASLLVVGSRGRGGFSGALLGSVSQHCSQHAPCPVVVVRGGEH
ncbi:universal stress protein [Streptomyces nigrescens]|uniref:Universal stress protein n=2 Tax=Streptomyces TaxID=1883 RepID=A0ABN6QVE2_STRNI|nr:universal stress protein [Streptomyces nigrescens]MEE4418282.1 universal stress protein [Streptomyces sp. DSM 41528]BDM69372.1 universal stress protein [Streptomyces nigrescens]